MKTKKESKLTSYLDSRFKVSARGSNIKTEFIGGFVNFLVMVYVMVVIPNILTGTINTPQFWQAIFLATVISVIIATTFLATSANLPLVSAPGIGLTTYFATLMSNGVYTYSETLTIAFVAGVLFVLLTLVGFRKKLIDALPNSLRVAIPAGIGLFILNIALNSSNSGILKFLTEGPLSLINQSPVYLSAIVSIFGFLLILILTKYKVKGAIFFGIISATILHFILQFATGHNPFAILSGSSWLPPFKELFSESLLKFDFKGVFVGDGTNIFGRVVVAGVIIFSYILVDLFDTVGTLFGATRGTNLVDANGNIQNVNRVFWIDSTSTVYGAMLGVPGCTVYVESIAGMQSGARTGLSSLVVVILFILSLFLSPLFMLIPASATAPALMFVGVTMFMSITDINFDNFIEAISSIATIIIMPFTNNIAFGIGVGLIIYTTLMVASKKHKELNFVTYLLAIMFILFFATQNII